MKPWKKPYLLLLVISICFALLSSCGTSTTGSPATPTPRGRTSTATSTALPTSQPTSPPSACGVWSKVASPNVGTSTNFLHGVAAISMNDVWAVGSSIDDKHGSLTLVEHWNGTQWNVVASPNVDGSTDDELLGVAAIAGNDIWVVGDSSIDNPGSHTQQALIEHWNGTEWSIIESSSVALEGTVLRAISAVSAIDIWAIGAGATGTLIAHWNGTTWSVVRSPVGSSDRLLGVTAVSATDAWAVGTGIGSYGWQTLIEHWNGTQWDVVARGPRPGRFTNELDSIAASSANDVWVVGSAYGLTPSSPYYPLIEHWDGSRWSIVKIPLPGYAAGLSSIAVTSASDIWAVGDYENEPGEPGPSFTLVEHWNGSTWSVVNSPSPGSFGNDLVAAVRVPATRSIWAVGSTERLNIGQSSSFQTLTELYC
jgi:hypothetical protein